jgi:hypothetical protein
MQTAVKILAISEDTPAARVFVTEKPENYDFSPGQATEVAVAKSGWRDKERPFTFTSLPDDPQLEFTIKTYPDHDGVTDEMRHLEIGDELLLGDPWGAIEYQGPGLFIAGGAGITPFLAILRDLHQRDELEGNILLYSNSKTEGIIAAAELKTMLGDACNFFVTDGDEDDYREERLTKDILEEFKEDADGPYFYLCGPPEMVEEFEGYLEELEVPEEYVVTENS